MHTFSPRRIHRGLAHFSYLYPPRIHGRPNARPQCLRSLSGQQATHAFQQAVHGKRFANVIVHAQHFRICLMPAAFIGGNHDHPQGTGLVRRTFSNTRKPLRLGIIMSRMTRSGSSRSTITSP